MSSPLIRVRDGVVWYLKQVSGEAKWDEYVERCRRDGVEPMCRKDFERHRTDHREHNAQSRCC